MQWKRISNSLSIKPKITGCIVFFILILVTLFMLSQQYEIAKKTKRTTMANELSIIQENIEQSLKNCYTTTLSLALTINDNGVPSDFKTIGAQLMASNSDIEAVQLVPDGIIRYIYPLKGNEKAIGLNILQDKTLKDEALASILKRKMYFAGPLNLAQGGQGIIGRLPIYNNNRFWGFSAVLLKLDRLLKTAGVDLQSNSKYYFQFSKKNPLTQKEIFYLKKDKEIERNPFVSAIIPDGNWKVYLFDKNPKSIYSTLITPALLGLFVSLWFGYITFLLVKKPAELQTLIKQQATKLFKSELQFQTIFKQAGIGIASADPKTGRFMEINDHFCDILGFRNSELKEKSFKEITHPDDLENDLIQLEKINQGFIESYSQEKRYISKNGSEVWGSVIISPLWNEKKEHISNIAFLKDITARKINEAIIISSKQKNEALINTIDGIVWETDAEVNFTFISKKVEDILGYTSQEWLSSKSFWSDHIYHEDKEFVLNFCKTQTTANLDHDFEYRMIAKNGNIVWLRDIVNLSRDPNGKLLNLRGIMIDITKTKEIEADLNKSLYLVTEQNKRLLNFSYIVSHNLRSHTSNITSLINLIETSESKEEIEQMLTLLKTVSNSLNETMLNLNEVVNIQTNIGLVTEDLNLKKYVLNSLQVLETKIKEKHATVNVNISSEITVNYNPAYLESVLYNLISNAIRYSDPHKELIIDINLTLEGTTKFLEIIDNGIGIDLLRNGDKIFGMYKTFTNHKDSKGIGLFITKNQIEAMGGNITITSEINEGTAFKIKMA